MDTSDTKYLKPRIKWLHTFKNTTFHKISGPDTGCRQCPSKKSVYFPQTIINVRESEHRHIGWPSVAHQTNRTTAVLALLTAGAWDGSKRQDVNAEFH